MSGPPALYMAFPNFVKDTSGEAGLETGDTVSVEARKFDVRAASS